MQLVAYRKTEAGIAARKPIAQVAAKPAPKAALPQPKREELADGLGREDIRVEIAALSRQRDELMAVVASHREHVALLVRYRQEAERAMLNAAQALTRFRALEERMTRTTSVHTIARRICKALGVSKLDLVSDSRSANVTFARHAVCYWAVRRTPLSMPQIGKFLGKRDHTTIMHGRDSYIEKRAKMGRTLRPVR